MVTLPPLPEDDAAPAIISISEAAVPELDAPPVKLALPPTWADAAVNSTVANATVDPLPGATITEPRVVSLDPVANEMPPEDPVDVVPVENSNAPLVPASPASTVRILMLPDDFPDVSPPTRLMNPPVLALELLDVLAPP